MKRPNALRAVAALALLAALPLVADAQAKPKLRLAYVCGGMNAMVGQLPLNDGSYEKAGLDVEKVCFQAGAPAVQALVGKSVDVFLGSSEHILRAQARGIPLKAYMCLQNGIGYALVTKSDAKVKTLADLKGETVAVTAPKTLSDTGLHRGLQDAGLNPDRDVTIISAGSGATMLAALETGRAVAGMVSQPELDRLVASKKYRVLYDPAFEYAGIVVMARADWVDQNKTAMQLLARTIAQATAAANRDPAAAARTMRVEFPQVEQPVMVDAVKDQLKLVPGGFVVPRKGLQDVNDIEVRDKNIPAAIPYEQVVDASFLNAAR